MEGLRFIYDAGRPDPISSWVSGIEIVKPTRISQIEMWAPPPNGGTLELAREYRLGYAESTRSHRSLLVDVTLCDGVGACLPATSFRYAEPPSAPTAELAYNVHLTPLEDEVFSATDLPHFIPLDANGDGFDDLLYGNAEWFQQCTGGGSCTLYETNIPRLAFSSGVGTSPIITPGTEQGWFDSWNMVTIPVSSANGPMSSAFDHDQDGEVDWFSLERDNNNRQRFVRELGAPFAQMNDTAAWHPSLDNCDAFAIECAFNTGDFDGDGLPDVMNPRHDPLMNKNHWRLLINDDTSSTGSFSEHPQSSIALKQQNFELSHVVDFDGDGAHDLLDYNEQGEFRRIWIEDGVLQSSDYSAPNLEDVVMADINGDGLSDVVRVAPIESIEFYDGDIIYGFGPPVIYFNTGNGFKSPPTTLPGMQLAEARSQPRTVAADFNGDGRDDILVLTPVRDPMHDDELWLSVGHELVGTPPGTVTGSINKLPHYSLSYEGTPLIGHMPFALADVDNDGHIDIVALTFGQGSYTCEGPCIGGLELATYTQDVGPEPYHDRLVEVVDGLGRRDQVLYDKHSPHGTVDPDPTYLYDGEPCGYPVKCMTKGGPLVASHLVSDDHDPTNLRAWSYRYRGHRADLRGRGSLGFSTITKTDSATGAVEVTSYHQDVYGSQWPFGEVKAYPRAGMVERRSSVHSP